MSEKQSEQIVELTETQMDDVEGGLLLPAVQKVREAAARPSGADGGENGIIAVLIG